MNNFIVLTIYSHIQGSSIYNVGLPLSLPPSNIPLQTKPWPPLDKRKKRPLPKQKGNKKFIWPVVLPRTEGLFKEITRSPLIKHNFHCAPPYPVILFP